jgi:hypothetical protein
MSSDARRDFEKDPQRVALVPSGERIEAVIRATPAGEVAAQTSVAEMRLGAAGALVGAAARKVSERNAPEAVPGGIALRWPQSSLYWIVLTDRALRVFPAEKGSTGTHRKGASFAHDEVDRLEIGQSFVIKPMRLVFTDGSAVMVDCAGGLKTDDFVAAAERSFSGGVTRDLKDTSGFWVWAWLGILGLLLGALATGVGATVEGGKSAVVLRVIASVCALLATWWWIARWSRVRWNRWGVALTLLVLGTILTGASLDKASCDCPGMISLGAPFVVIGLVALGGRIATRR